MKRALYDDKSAEIVKILTDCGDFEDEALSLLCTAVLKCSDPDVFGVLCDAVRKNPAKREALKEKIRTARELANDHQKNRRPL